MSQLKILQIVPRIAAESSGPSVSVPSLSRSLAEIGHDVNLFTLRPRPKHQLFQQTKFFPTTPLPLCYRLGVSPSMKRAIRDAMPAMDIVHTNSLWMMPNVYPGVVKDRGNCKLVISPRGTVSEWALSRARFRKGLVWRMGQRKSLESADLIHVTSMDEMADVRRLGLKNPVAVIANGVICPVAYRPRDPSRSERTCLFLARIHPKKGLDHLLQAWRSIVSTNKDWKLVIAGPTRSAYAAKLKADVESSALPRIEFVGEVTGEAKIRLLNSSDLYILPTHSENFGISIAEALAHGLPSIVYKGAPWSELDSRKAGWWIDTDAEVLAETIVKAMTLSDEEREMMGMNAQRWMQSEYDWKRLGVKTGEVYQWLCRRDTEKPAEVHVT